MKKKLLSILLAVTLVAGTLVGCGEKENDSKDDKAVETVQQDDEEDKTGEDSDAGKVVDLGNGLMMEYPGGDDGLIEMEGEVTIIEDNGEIQPDADSDWATAYADYSYMSYTFDNASLELYATAEKIYAHMEMVGEESWIYAPVTSEEEVDSVMSMAGETNLVDAEDVTSCTYVEEVVENGVVYDVLLLEVNDEGTTGEVFYYVNRESQKVDKFIMEQEGQLIECFVEEISSIELPTEAANATEGTLADIAGALSALLLMGMEPKME